MHAYDFEPATDPETFDAWSGGAPRGLLTDAWPRSRVTGFPMVHLLTVRLPEDYRHRGPGIAGLAVFQADDHVASPIDGVQERFEGDRTPADDDFIRSLDRYLAARHPEERYLEDQIGGGFAIVWLTEAELAGEPTPLPEDERPDDYESVDGMNAWDHTAEEERYVLRTRVDDPNVGKGPTDHPDDAPDAYVPWHRLEEPLRSAIFERNHLHLGGTATPAQGTPEVSPYYLEFNDGIGGANFGGGAMQIDLTCDFLDWAC